MNNFVSMGWKRTVTVFCSLLLAVSAAEDNPAANAAAVPAADNAEASVLNPVSENTWWDFWVFRLLMNQLGYATILIPGYLIISYVRRTKYVETAGPNCHSNLIRLCVQGNEQDKGSVVEEGGAKTETAKPERTFWWNAAVLVYCTLGLQASYLVWGMLQERIMSIKYGASDSSEGENFKNSTFLVWVNRILAFIVAMIVITCRPQPRHTAPLYKYSFSSYSNIMSSWCQYEALKFVSFPTQVLAKSCKVVAVMIMGIFVSKRTFEVYEYVSAVMIAVGVSVFMLNSKDAMKDHGTTTVFSGLIILVGYLAFDSFTANWQGELFRTYKMSANQMMAGVNMFSVIFTTVALLEQGGFIESLAFMGRHPPFVIHSILLSICSAVGQLFIFYTISEFGPVTFTIIMTVRQILAILLSCFVYSHPVSMESFVGVVVVFAAIFGRIYYGHRKRAAAKAANTGSSQKV